MLCTFDQPKTFEDVRDAIDEAYYNWLKLSPIPPCFVIVNPNVYAIIKQSLLPGLDMPLGSRLTFRDYQLFRSLDLKETELIIC